MSRDLSNARIIEWVYGGDSYSGELRVANRDKRGAPFRFGGVTLMTEAHAADLGARVVAEFPAPLLAEIVGDAPAFTFIGEELEPYIAHRCSDWSGKGDDGVWQAVSQRPIGLWFTRPLHAFPEFDLSTVVPLRPTKQLTDALRGLVTWHGRRDGDKDELLPPEEQPREIARAMRLLGGVS